MRRALTIAITVTVTSLAARQAAAELRLPCLWKPFGGCSSSFVSPEYAKKPVEPLDPEAALAAINAYRTANGRNALVLDDRLNRAAAVQSQTQAGRSWIGHYGSDGSTALARARRAGFKAKIASENVAAGLKSFADVLAYWKQSSGHRTNLLRGNVTAIGVAMAKNESGRPYWTLVLGGE
ncbi:MAG TPA: CAP domain-containing protein [Methyloceanibacter sp.]|nr:CAP domain-containing protein [Methyloceanibacter sp.]